jgi:hypothetical protein
MNTGLRSILALAIVLGCLNYAQAIDYGIIRTASDDYCEDFTGYIAGASPACFPQSGRFFQFDCGTQIARKCNTSTCEFCDETFDFSGIPSLCIPGVNGSAAQSLHLSCGTSLPTDGGDTLGAFTQFHGDNSCQNEPTMFFWLKPLCAEASNYGTTGTIIPSCVDGSVQLSIYEGSNNCSGPVLTFGVPPNCSYPLNRAWQKFSIFRIGSFVLGLRCNGSDSQVGSLLYSLLQEGLIFMHAQRRYCPCCTARAHRCSFF